MKQIFFISGMPHSATRLVYNLLESSGDFGTPDDEYLNSVKELPTLHAYLTNLTRRTRLSEDLDVDIMELSFLLKAYIQACKSTESVLIKMPFYPVVYSSVFEKAASSLGYKVSFVIVEREFEKIKKSFVSRNEDLKYSQPETLLSQINRLPKEYKLKGLCLKSYNDVLQLQFDCFSKKLSLLKDSSHCYIVSVNDLDLLQNICTGPVKLNLVNNDRLKNNKKEMLLSVLKKLERKYLEYKTRKY